MGVKTGHSTLKCKNSYKYMVEVLLSGIKSSSSSMEIRTVSAYTKAVTGLHPPVKSLCMYIQVHTRALYTHSYVYIENKINSF